MINPYNQLYIYYFDGVPKLDESIQTNGDFLGTWVEEAVAFLFFSALSDNVVETILKNNDGVRLIEKYEMTGEQWHGDKIEPYYVNDLCICPPWNRSVQNDGSIKDILLDPGVP